MRAAFAEVVALACGMKSSSSSVIASASLMSSLLASRCFLQQAHTTL